MKQEIKEFKKGLDEKVFFKNSLLSKIPGYTLLFGNKNIKVIIINEDRSTTIYFKNLPKSYLFEISKKSYFLIADRILKIGDTPHVFYFFNNPFPIEFKYLLSKFKPIDLKSEEELKNLTVDQKSNLASVSIDAESLHLASNTRFIKGLYYGEGMTTKTLLYIIGAVLIGILVLLQITGKVDVIGQINSMVTGR